VLRVVARGYQGEMIGLRTGGSPRTLWLTGDHYVLCAKRTTSYGAHRSWKHIPGRHFERARGMRTEMTEAERLVWRILRGEQLAVKFRRQHPIGPYIVDFYSWQAGLVVEIDGDSHFSDEAQVYDQERSQYLEALGLTVLRFTNAVVRQSLPEVVDRILYATSAVRPSEDHYREWRRANSLRQGDFVYAPREVYPPQSPRQRGEAGFLPADSAGQGHDGMTDPALGERATNSLPVDGEGWGGVLSTADGNCPGRLLLIPMRLVSIERQIIDETIYNLEVERSHSFITESCVVHNCGGRVPAHLA
jgi:very-short-patch-repair endonuclease